MEFILFEIIFLCFVFLWHKQQLKRGKFVLIRKINKLLMTQIFIYNLINSINIINNFDNKLLFQFYTNRLNDELQIINNIKLIYFKAIINK